MLSKPQNNIISSHLKMFISDHSSPKLHNHDLCFHNSMLQVLHNTEFDSLDDTMCHTCYPVMAAIFKTYSHDSFGNKNKELLLTSVNKRLGSNYNIWTFLIQK